MQVAPSQKTSQFPGFRITVAQQMADYRRRMAEKIAKEREAQSLSREALAYRAGVSDKTIKRIEQEKTDPRPVTVRRIAEGLGIDPSDLRPPPEMEDAALKAIRAQLDRLEVDLRELRTIAKEWLAERDAAFARQEQVREHQQETDQPAEAPETATQS